MSLCVRSAPGARLRHRGRTVSEATPLRSELASQGRPAASIHLQGAAAMTLLPLGINVSKAKFDVCLVRDTGKLKHRAFPNTPAGFAQLSEWLAKLKAERVHACLEATGAYSEALATYL